MAYLHFVYVVFASDGISAGGLSPLKLVSDAEVGHLCPTRRAEVTAYLHRKLVEWYAAAPALDGYRPMPLAG